MAVCPSDNQVVTDQSSFWSSSGVHWDAHRIGWAISGGCSLLTLIISIISVLGHARNYTVREEQRQIIRILYMPPVYAIISFFSYRFFRSYTYYELIEVVYEAITISAFLLLIMEYVASTASGHSLSLAMERKDKKKLPIPFCCWRYRPTKAYFLYTLKWSVMQYVIIRPLISVISIIAQAYNVLCENGGMNFHFVYVYVEIVDCISITVALYGLLMFYGLTKEELKGKRPLAKFLCIKLIVMFTFYQSFVFSWMEGSVIKATPYWTATNIADGLTALTICIEMVLFAAGMMWAYPSTPYRSKEGKTSIGRPLLDSINYSDFAREIMSSIRFFIDYLRGKPGTHTPKSREIGAGGKRTTNFAQTFGAQESSSSVQGMSSGSNFGGVGGTSMRAYNSNFNAGVADPSARARDDYSMAESGSSGRPSNQFDENVPLTTFGERKDLAGSSKNASDLPGLYSYRK
ncbi:hypothetical protein M0805_000461 [Coniferiporia weirii]|nr:hypothetical protein M0805_000461 [Coniferiporia weirii]